MVRKLEFHSSVYFGVAERQGEVASGSGLGCRRRSPFLLLSSPLSLRILDMTCTHIPYDNTYMPDGALRTILRRVHISARPPARPARVIPRILRRREKRKNVP